MSVLDPLIRSGRTLVVPGVHDALGARMTEDAGFEAVAVGGSAIAAMQAALPDIGLLSFGEYSHSLEQIVTATDVPVLVDGENGFGDVKSVTRVVGSLDRLGVASVAFEDLAFPPTYGVAPAVVPLPEISAKLVAALEARTGDGMWIIGRTDAAGVRGLDEAIARARHFADLGVDAVMLTGVADRDQLARVRDEIPTKIVALIIEDGPWAVATPDELSALGYEVAIYPATLTLAAVTAYRDALEGIAAGRTSLPAGSAGYGAMQAALRPERWARVDETARARGTGDGEGART